MCAFRPKNPSPFDGLTHCPSDTSRPFRKMSRPLVKDEGNLPHANSGKGSTVAEGGYPVLESRRPHPLAGSLRLGVPAR